MIEIFIANTPDNARHAVGAWMSLGDAFENMYHQVSHSVADLDKAIEAFRTALRLKSQGSDSHISPGILECGLGAALVDRYNHHEDVRTSSELDEGIALLQEAVDKSRLISSTDGGSRLANAIHKLGYGLAVRCWVRRDGTDLARAMALFSSVPRVGGPPRKILYRVWEWARLALKYMDSVGALEAYQALVEQVTVVAGMEYTIERRHELLEEHSTWIVEAADVAIRAGRADKSLEWLEQGRGLVWKQLTALRTPLAEIEAFDAKLGRRLREVCRDLDALGSNRFSSVESPEPEAHIKLHEEASSHFQLAKKREKLLKKVRKTVPNFKTFLVPQPCSVFLDALPDDGPVVVVNLCEFRCFAIILIKGAKDPIHIPLPNFLSDFAADLTKALDRSLSRKVPKRRSDPENSDGEVFELGFPSDSDSEVPVSRYTIERILRELWVGIVDPVLRALQVHLPSFEMTRCEGTPSTRLWWCPTGPLTSLPLHAAGIYSEGDTITVADYVVSSYIPTVGLLAERLKRPHEIPAKRSGLLLVSVPKSFDKESCYISGTIEEIQCLKNQFSKTDVRVRQLEGEYATSKRALKYMARYSCVHLACHGSQKSDKPLKSQFSLQDAALDLATIIQANLKSADLAFLSACETGTGTQKLSEEAVHLAAGMLAAGYRGVVATMWAINDKYAPQVAEEFYQDLIARTGRDAVGAKQIDGKYAAYALHHAVGQLRKRIGDTEQSLLAWVPYVHFGL